MRKVVLVLHVALLLAVSFAAEDAARHRATELGREEDQGVGGLGSLIGHYFVAGGALTAGSRVISSIINKVTGRGGKSSLQPTPTPSTTSANLETRLGVVFPGNYGNYCRLGGKVKSGDSEDDLDSACKSFFDCKREKTAGECAARVLPLLEEAECSSKPCQSVKLMVRAYLDLL